MNRNVNRSTECAGRRLRLFVVLPAVTVMVFVAAGSYAAARQSRRTVWEGIYNEAQATRGKQLYVGNCSACHQESLQGADLAPALKGDSFVLRWSDSSVDDMVTAISASMPFDAPGSLAAQQYVDIVMYLLSENKFPAGKEEIKADPAVLKAIAITKESGAK
jgi:cytochrome c